MLMEYNQHIKRMESHVRTAEMRASCSGVKVALLYIICYYSQGISETSCFAAKVLHYSRSVLKYTKKCDQKS